MALPYTETEDGSRRRGSYSPGEAVDAVRPIRVRRLEHDNINAANFFNKIPLRSRNVWGRFYAEMKAFKTWMSRKCCRCVGKIPIKIFIAMIFLILFITIVLLILLILLIKGGSGSSSRTSFAIPTDITDLAGQIIPTAMYLCKGHGFTCKQNPWVVIGTLKRCDGVLDCPDGSDEIGCKRCRTSFNCTMKIKTRGSYDYACLLGSKLCDGSSDCQDQSDEIKFCRSVCQKEEFKCESGDMCIPKTFVCDGDKHCKDGSDEFYCRGNCKNNAIWCEESGRCLAQTNRCDGVSQCPNGVDEEDCNCVHCSGNSNALCSISKRCIKFTKICDGNQDCEFNEDELNCPGNCETNFVEGEDKYKCKDGNYHHKKFACSGLFKECNGICKECDPELAFTCANKQCVHKTLICDGKKDCDDASDESNCECSEVETQGAVFKCNFNGGRKCIPMASRCDGIYDCLNGKDEQDCDYCNNSEGFYCNKTRTCLLSTKRCDGTKDCPDGSDEYNCTCNECKLHPWPTYFCSKSKECLERTKVCTPYSKCAEATSFDKMYCAKQEGLSASRRVSTVKK